MAAGTSTGIGGWAERQWQAVRSLSDRTPLRTKLITALLSLVVIALAAIGVSSVFVLRSYLTSQDDRQLQAAFGGIPGNPDNMATLESNPGRLVPVKYTSNLFAGVQSPGNPLSAPSLPPGLTFGGLGEPQSVPAVPTSLAWAAANNGKLVTVRAQSGSQTWRVIAEPISYATMTSSGSTQQVTGTLVVGADLGNVNSVISRLTIAELIVGGVIVCILAAAVVGVVRANLRPLLEIEETAEQIAAGHLNRRVPERDPRTEIGSLGRSLNLMLGQIETAFHAREESEAAAHRSEERMRRFIADASHELRTPLTAIRGFAEYYRQRGGLAAGEAGEGGLAPEDLERIMQRVEKEASRMGLLVEDLLLLARLDQQRPLARQPVDLLTLAADAVGDARLLAPDRAIELHVQPGAAFLVLGDEARLRQVIGNLMSNALTHTPDGTPVEVSIGSGPLGLRADSPEAAVILDVTDHGPGMAPEQARRVFERFYRADEARTRKTGGSGLGLAIVAALVRAHGGIASVRTSPGHGATFRVALPLAPEAAGQHADDDLPGRDAPDGDGALPGARSAARSD
jgi:two-component system OmpR family sensor kinase